MSGVEFQLRPGCTARGLSWLGHLQALRSPLVAATISHLQHACLTSPWTVRVASAQALAKVKPLPQGLNKALKDFWALFAEGLLGV